MTSRCGGEDQLVRPRDPSMSEAFDWGRRRFLDESRTLASFRHPNIVRVMRFFEANATAYMVREFVEGEALPDWARSRQPMSEAHVREVIAPLIDGLEVVHNGGSLHRDIKPGNIFMRREGGPALIDFGSARQKLVNTELTAIVTPGYAPFEQYHEQVNQGPWSDLYAIGGVMYWMVTGNRPAEAAGRIRNDPMPSAVQVGDKKRFRAEFLAAIDWALAPHEEKRPQNVAQLRAALGGGPAAEEKTLKIERTAKVETGRAQPGFSLETLEMLKNELAQHLGPIASVVVKKAAQSAPDYASLVRALATEVPEGAQRAAFEKRYGERNQPPSKPPAPVQKAGEPATALAQARYPAKVLERAEQRLSEYIGAVARVVVKRAALKARDEGELYLLIADEIEDKNEKKAFIRKAISVSGKP